MKRYLAFGGADYYAVGGWHDFVGDFDEMQPAIAAANARAVDCSETYNWWHVIDIETGKAVAENIPNANA